MKKYTGYSGHASLAILGQWMKGHEIWEEVEERVKIKQKVIKHTPLEKLKDELVNMLAGGGGVADINNRLRVDKGIQKAFGRKSCAEQSTISETLNASTEANVAEMNEALKRIYQKQGRGYRHDYERQCLVLDIDLSALLAGEQAEGASKGYFSGHENRRGRQLGRVTASGYKEIVGEKLYVGTIQLEKNLPELIQMAENVLGLDEKKRNRTILRIDAGGGTDANINFILERGYLGMTKIKNWQRTCKLAKTVTSWQSIPQLPDHECGWVEEAHAYVRPTRQLAIRWPNKKKKDAWHYCVMVFNLSDELIFEVVHRRMPHSFTDLDRISTIVDAYDLRGGGVETSYRNSKQGIGLTKRNKKSFPAQEILVLLAQLAFNLTLWVQQELARFSARIASFGLLRMIRDAFQIGGIIQYDDKGRIRSITLNKTHKLARPFRDYANAACLPNDLCVILGKI